MSDKKLIIFAVVASILLIVGGFFYSQKYGQTKNPSGSQEENQTISGIIVGDPKAPLNVQVYTSFMCPACQHFALNTFPKIQEEYIKTGKVKFEFIISPPYELGQAVLCAQEQGKFMVYHDFLFAHQSEIQQVANLYDLAQDAGLDKDALKTCLESGKYLEQAKKWQEQSNAAGVTGTPTFFVGSQENVIPGSYDFSIFKEAIDRELQ